ncbi:MAG: YchF/TatD family DNA exonuclease [Nitrospirae bacterium]|nr:YchF/TatD family DNA exonuclease [Nitrospirota bacterium]
MEGQVATSHEPRATSHDSALADSHTHLVMFKPEDRAGILARARAQNVHLMVVPGTTLADSAEAVEFARGEPDVFATVGVHPHEAKDAPADLEDRLTEWAGDGKVAAIGEIGLDFHYNLSPRDVQQACFERQLALARKVRKPIVVHIREAFGEARELMQVGHADEVGGVIHCFTGTYNDAKSFLDLGFCISFSGILTFPKADSLREAARKIPIERILIETDAPYLAPVPHRGKENEPAFLPHTAQVLADLKSLAIHDVARITCVNTRRVFRIAEDAVRTADGRSKAWPKQIDLHPKIAYRIRDSVYLNITNKCTISCVFCPKFDDFMVKGHYLKLSREPDASTILSEIGDLAGVQEVVFCGFGESTLRMDALKDTARALKAKGVKVRLDTDGLGNLVHGRNILPELKGLIDSVSISLNASNPEEYARLCPSKYEGIAYPAVKEFIREAKVWIPDVQATVVTVPGVNVEACRRIVEDELGVRFRAREYNNVG